MSIDKPSPEVAHDDAARDDIEPGDTITPLEGEHGIPSVTQRSAADISRKGIFALGLAVLSLLALSAVSINRALQSSSTDKDAAAAGLDRPSAAATEPRRLDMSLPAPPTQPSVSTPDARIIPAIVPTPDELPADPIHVHRREPPTTAPEDAPVVLVSSRPGFAATPANATAQRGQGSAQAGEAAGEEDSLEGTRRNLAAYQRQLQTLMESLTASTASTRDTPQESMSMAPVALAGAASPVAPAMLASPMAHGRTSGATPAGLFGGEWRGSTTPRVSAGTLASPANSASPGQRSLTLAKGTTFTCALTTRVVSASSGLVGCQVQRNVFGDDGRVLLIERGSHLDGEYRAASVRPGTVRIPVLWTRIRTPHGVTVDIDSPGTGQLGESGIDGHVENRWRERIGAAMLLSLIDDSVKLVIQTQANRSEDDGHGNTIVLPSTTANTGKLAEKVLDSTINIPPLIQRNQGGIVGIVVARDVDFSSVYELKPSPRDPPRQALP